MKKYIAFNIVNKVKFYRTNKNEWSSTKENLKIFLEYETEDFFNISSFVIDFTFSFIASIAELAINLFLICSFKIDTISIITFCFKNPQPHITSVWQKSGFGY